ncbi:MAG: dihydroneopterin aldolase family protein [Methanomicrobiales archaeon]|nr:dihydroneopterin aldolase family protein [Methanomicrobiales archaeon]
MTNDRELAIFEAAIKLGALYHQWVGAPVSRASAESLEKAIEKSVILQPYVDEISVRLDRSLMTPNEHGYSEVRGLMFHVEIITRVGFSYCRARLSPKDDYPYMEIVECIDDGKNSPD